MKAEIPDLQESNSSSEGETYVNKELKDTTMMKRWKQMMDHQAMSYDKQEVDRKKRCPKILGHSPHCHRGYWQLQWKMCWNSTQRIHADISFTKNPTYRIRSSPT